MPNHMIEIKKSYLMDSKAQAIDFCNLVMLDPENPTTTIATKDRIDFYQRDKLVVSFKTIYNDGADTRDSILRWFGTALRESTLSDEEKIYAFRMFYGGIMDGSLYRGNVSDGLVEHYGRDVFLNSNLYL